MNPGIATMADVVDVEPAVAHPIIERHDAQSLRTTTRTALAITPAQMLQIAVESNADIEKLKSLMELYEKWEAREAQRAYDASFAAFKSEAVKVLKGRQRTDGPLRGTNYAELHDVVDAVTPALSKYNLSSSWKVTKDDRDWIEVTCYIRHVDGHEESVSMGGPPDNGPAKNAVQARTSTITYLERQTLKAACGVAEKDDDDDGAGGSDHHSRQGNSSGGGQRSQKRNSEQSTSSDNRAAPGNATQATDDRPTYDQAKFNANKTDWKTIVTTGRKTPDGMIRFIETKGAQMTEAQKNEIRGWVKTDDQGAQ